MLKAKSEKELVPEAYCQRFWEKSGRQTRMEFARELVTHFNRWCASLGVNMYGGLCELIVLEQFKTSVPGHIATYINEHKVKTAAKRASLADEYVLMHRGDCECRARDNAGYKGDRSMLCPTGKQWEEGTGPCHGKPERPIGSQLQFDPSM